MKIRELLSDESKWTQHAVARDKYKLPLDNGYDKSAVCWCLVGALFKCYGDPERPERVNGLMLDVAKTIQDELPEKHCRAIAEFNDANTYQVIKALVDRLDV